MKQREQKQEKIEQKMAELEARVDATERVSRRRLLARVLGIGAGVIGGNYVGKNVVNGLGRSIINMAERTYRAGQAVEAVLNIGEEVPKEYLDLVNAQTREAYYKSNDKGYVETILKGSQVALDGLQRAALEMPGAKTKPIEGWVGIRSAIMRKTQPWKDSKELEERSTWSYADHYNLLSNIRDQSFRARQEIAHSMTELSKKIKTNEVRGNGIDNEGIKLLDEEMQKYNAVTGIIDSISKVQRDNVHGIFKGNEDADYTTIIEQANRYGIKPVVIGSWADNITRFAGYGGAAIGAYVGSKLGAGSYNVIHNAKKTIQTGAKITGGVIGAERTIGRTIDKAMIDSKQMKGDVARAYMHLSYR